MSEIITIDIRMINHSGIGTYIQNIVPILLEKRQNDKFFLIGKNNEIKQHSWINKKNVTVINCDSPIYSITEQFALKKLIPKSTSLFWSPHYNIPLFYRGKLITTIHDVFHLAFPEQLSLTQKLYSKIMFKAVNFKSNLIVTVSNFSKKELIEKNKTNFQKIRVVHNGVNRIENPKIKQTNNDLLSKSYLLYVGNVKPHKNLSNLLDAFEIIQEKENIDLIIVGKKDGFITPDKKVLKKAESLGSKVIFTGFISDELLAEYYKNAIALVFPSLYEGFGLPPLEAMVMKCPVISSNKASLPEVCQDSALYFNPESVTDIAEKIQTLLKDQKLQVEFKNKGVRHVQSFSWKKAAEETLTVMDEVIS